MILGILEETVTRITTTAAVPLVFMEIALTTQAPTDAGVTLDTQEKTARLTLMNVLHRRADMELVLIKSTATSVSVTLGILAMIAKLRSTNASLRPVFAAYAVTN